MLTLTHASLATVEQLFRYKNRGFTLEPFPGYTPDQWGIKAHNRPWIEEVGGFAAGQRVIEVGGAYSLLPKYLGDRHGVEAWIGDDFGLSDGEAALWSRWGDPRELPRRYPSVKYVFERFGRYSPAFPNHGFDRVFSVSTLEHVPPELRLDVLKDMHRCLKPGGRQMHTIDVGTDYARVRQAVRREALPFWRNRPGRGRSEIREWVRAFEVSGVRIATGIPHPASLLDRATLVESPDVVYRCYPPNDAPKPYAPSASLLLVIEDR